ncbi:MAG: hypothetical protein MUF22_02790 [Chitinispirillaceae bacterium]|nr:hypothetical protein [Chitinispirillaceae bacterium]
MPATPERVRVYAPFIVTGPPGFVTAIRTRLMFAPRDTLLDEITVASHTAVSADVGTTPPTQLDVRLRASALLALEIFAANPEEIRRRLTRKPAEILRFTKEKI